MTNGKLTRARDALRRVYEWRLRACNNNFPPELLDEICMILAESPDEPSADSTPLERAFSTENPSTPIVEAALLKIGEVNLPRLKNPGPSARITMSFITIERALIDGEFVEWTCSCGHASKAEHEAAVNRPAEPT